MRRRGVMLVRVAMRVSIGPFAVVVVRVALCADGDAQSVQARGAGEVGVEMKVLGKERVDDLFDGGHVRAQRREGGKDHIAAGTAHAIETKEFCHVGSLQKTRCEVQREKQS